MGTPFVGIIEDTFADKHCQANCEILREGLEWRGDRLIGPRICERDDGGAAGYGHTRHMSDAADEDLSLTVWGVADIPLT